MKRAAWTLIGALAIAAPAYSQPPPTTPPDQRGNIGSERSGTHDAANIRTVFYNFGMVGGYPEDPLNVDLTTFHSVEVPKGSGMNYSDGITPFVLAQIPAQDGSPTYIMETGYRERQGISPFTNREMRFEPRPGFFEPSPLKNKGRSPAISNDPRTWPTSWPDKLNDPDDPGWSGSWDGYFGKRPAADQESFTVMDDQAYDAWPYYIPDTRDSSRRGLGLRVEVRGFQWANPQAGNVIFWHYDITNESTTDYNDNIIFGLYMDSGVGGSTVSCDQIPESDDDNAFWDKNAGLNLVYTWDTHGHGRDLSGPCGTTGYLGYAYLETPGNPFDGIDNDNDGITDERRDSGPGIQIVGQDAIRAYVYAHYDTTKFFATYGPLVGRPAYRQGVWWTGDEDMDWRLDVDDVGADGVPNTHDTGEGDGIPTDGEPNFDRTDLHESDQIGLTGFKLNRIRQGYGNPDPHIDDILFYDNPQHWPSRLWDHFTDPNPAARFDSALAANYNVAFLFASGPFRLPAGAHERFSLALAFGQDLPELRDNVQTVQVIYNANYQFAVPPSLPTATAEAGDGFVRLSWDDIAERSIDPVTGLSDFEGYRIYRSTDPEFRDPKTISTGRGGTFPGNGVPLAQFDLADGKRGYSKKTISGVAYWLGNETGIKHTFTDSTAVNGQQYYYAVCAYDYGYEPGGDSTAIYPSENAIAVSRTARGGIILPPNVVSVIPNVRVPGFASAGTQNTQHVLGDGTGSVDIQVVNSNLIPSNHLFKLTFATPDPESILATSYSLSDSTTHRLYFSTGTDFDSVGSGPVGSGLLPVIFTQKHLTVDSTGSKFDNGFQTNAQLFSSFQTTNTSINLRRRGYPDDIRVEFDSAYVDTGLALGVGFPARRAKFKIFAETPQGDLPMDFRFFESGTPNGLLDRPDEKIDILTGTPPYTTQNITWRIQLDPNGATTGGPLINMTKGDVYHLRVHRPLNATDVYTFKTDSSSVAQPTGSPQPKPYVVPNPYVGSASFEPAPFAVSGRGERRIEFRNIPINAVIRIYTVRGDLVQTLRQDGSSSGFVPWNLRTKDNLDLAPGLYVYNVEAPGFSGALGKFAVIK
jgi:hypothetical protein